MEVIPEVPSEMVNPNGLRVARTIYSLEALNDAQKSGNICIVRRRTRNPALESRELMLRNRETSEYVTVPDRTVYRQYGQGVQEFPEEDWELVFTLVNYGRSYRANYLWGAYILPSDAQIGEKFLIADLIEDLLAASFWYSAIAAESAAAIWTGNDLELIPTSYEKVLVG